MKWKLLSVILGIVLIAFSVSANAASLECVFNNSTICESSAFGSLEPVQGIVQFEGDAIKMTDANRLIYTNNAGGKTIIGKQGSIEMQFTPLDWNSESTIQKMLFYSDGGLNQLSIRVLGNLSPKLRQLQASKYYPVAEGETLHVVIGSITGMTLQSRKAPYLIKEYDISNWFGTSGQTHAVRIEWNDSEDKIETFIDGVKASPLLSVYGLAWDDASQTFKTPLPSQQKFDFTSNPMTQFSIGSYVEQTTDILGKKTWLSADSLIYSTNITNPLVSEPDTQAPEISIIQPLPDTLSNNKRQEIKAQLSDDSSGIKAGSIIFRLNGVQYRLGDSATGRLSLASDTNVLTFTPKTDLNGEKTARIELTDNAGNPASIDWSFTVDSTPMNAISNLSSELNGNETITLNWGEPSFEGAGLSFYKIYKSNAPLTESTKSAFFLQQTTDISFTDSAISKNTYYYYVTTVDEAGNESLLSNEARIIVEGFVQLSADHNSISLQEGTSKGITLRVFNDTKERQDISFSTETDDSYLRAELALDELSLNRNERTSFALNIIAEDGIDSGEHTVTVTMNYAGIERTLEITVNAGASGFTGFELQRTSFCNSEFTIRVPVDITNNSDNFQSINLSAHNSTFNPSWDDSAITLDSGETETIDLLLHNTPSRNLTGDYNIELTAENSGNETVQEITVELRDCSINPITDFSLSTDSSSIDLRKNETRKISYSIHNLSDSDQYINVSIETSLQADYNSLVFVQANHTYTDFANLKAGLFQEPGTYDFKIRAFNSDFTREKTVKVRLLATHYFEQTVSENAFSLMQGNSKTIYIDIKNADFAENFTLSTDTNDSSITSGISETSFTMQPRTVKRISLTINAGSNASTGGKTVYLRTSTGSVSQKTLSITVNVAGKPAPPELRVVEALSYPLEVQLNPGESRELSFIIFNPSKETAITSVEITGLPNGVSFESIEEAIPSMQKKELKGTLKAAGNARLGSFTASSEINAFGKTQSKDLTVKVGQQGFFTGLITGFLSLGESVWLGVIVIIVIIVLLWLFAKAVGTERPKESWVESR